MPHNRFPVQVFGPGTRAFKEHFVWFEPAFFELRSLRSHPDARMQTFFRSGVPVTIGRAPGRLDVLGGIGDYSGSNVLEMTLAEATHVVVQESTEPQVCIATIDGDEASVFEMPSAMFWSYQSSERLRSRFSGRDDHWAAYVAGVLHYLLIHERIPETGLRILVRSDVPVGKGVSSSAALETATMLALCGHLGVRHDGLKLAEACRWVENTIVGAPCGIMDQVACMCGEAGKLLHLECRPLDLKPAVSLPEEVAFYGIDSGIRHAVSGSDYTSVRTAAFMTYRILADRANLTVHPADDGLVRIDDARWNGYLAAVTEEEYDVLLRDLPESVGGAAFLDRFGGITDTITRVQPERSYPVRAAGTFPVRENARVKRFVEILTRTFDVPGDRREDFGMDPHVNQSLLELGSLMAQSHQGYSDCGLSTDGTDWLVHAVQQTGPAFGLYGARITGGGSGGTVAILGLAGATDVVREIAYHYANETGRTAQVFAGSSPGAALTGVFSGLVDSL